MQSADQAFPTGKNAKAARKLGCAFALLPLSAVILTVLSIWYLYTSVSLAANGVEASATVVRLEASSSSDGGTTYSPVFRYVVDGQEYEYESVNSSYPPSHEVGEVTTLLYNPENPAKARENSFWELWLLPSIMCPISFGMVVLSVMIPMIVRRMS